MKKEIKLNEGNDGLKLIQIEGELYLIDVKAEKGRWSAGYCCGEITIRPASLCVSCSKIIASTKPLDGCLLIQSKEDEVGRIIYDIDFRGDVNSFKAGYKANKGYSEEQMREAIKFGVDNSELIKRGCKNIEEFIQSLSLPRVEITFEGTEIKEVKQI